MNTHTTARAPLRPSECAAALEAQFRGHIVRDGPHGQFKPTEEVSELPLDAGREPREKAQQ